MNTFTISGLTLLGPIRSGYEEILSPEALDLVAELERRLDDERRRLLVIRERRQALLEAGEPMDFPEETQRVREGSWRIAPLPQDLQDRRVEITGPVEPKMIINALNSGAKLFMADFEDATTPTWDNLLRGQRALAEAVRGTLAWTDHAAGKRYHIGPAPAVLAVRPRGWHLDEAHVLLGGRPVSGALFDFGLFVHHNAQELVARGSGPYFYLPKLESHHEARLWREAFLLAEETLGLPTGTIKATVLIETLPAAFEMDEILYELRDHSAGLNCGRWDYIFSTIKKYNTDPARIFPDRGTVTMASPFLSAYARLAVRTGHRRGAPVIGGMAAFIPVKDDPAANAAALAQVKADKEREAGLGHDGTWVAHPGLIPVAQEVFDRLMPGPNQIDKPLEDGPAITAADLLVVPAGPRTEAGLRNNIAVALGYLEAWLRGTGCVPLFNLMEDAATAEIARAQVWQWRRHGVTLDDGRLVTQALIRALLREELDAWKARVGVERWLLGRFGDAAELFLSLTETDSFPEFLTLPAYAKLMAEER